MSDQLTKRRGRPPLDPSERKDGNLTFRTRGDLRHRLAEEARTNGRTISEEVEWRLERSLEGISGEYAEPVQYLRDTRALLGSGYDYSEAIEIGQAWGRLKNSHPSTSSDGKEWFEDDEGLKLVTSQLVDRIQCMLPIFASRRRRQT
ncbi:hypothetical protein MKK70_10020 [Methylobacterium sp. E-041]|uniref:hypothetical protein n=1 Tax=Methylobacterium sp. E-041 TaxID=2836573 RepID=UPI001FBB740A|nr:hypothetical protein [Methylobacterium sp. E-041]MCJ2105703.1 hypothetical protein [Methylobacterium sp. E-041]